MNREDSIHYAYDHGIPITATKEKVYSIDDNLWGRAIECGEMEDPWNVPPPGVWSLTKQTATEPRDLTIAFDAGVPVAVDDETMDLVPLIEHVGAVVGSYGWGRLDMVENRRVGIKSRETYECPSGLALIAAHQDLESICHERDLAREKQRLEIRYAELVYDGLWFSPLKQALDAFIAETQRFVTGEVRAAPRARVAARDRPARRRGRCTTTRSPPTTPATPSGTRTPPGSCGCGDCRRSAGRRSKGRGRRRDEGTAVTTLWHGRFEGGPSPELLAFSESLSFDRRLAADDIAGSRAHVRGLVRAGILTGEEGTVVLAALDRVAVELAEGTLEFQPSDEDVHTAIERRVTELAGSAGAKLHTGRSRNDQVATALRLFCKRELTGVAAKVVALQHVLLARADEAGGAYLPGYTHLQRAQPVLLAHHLLAHGWALARDVDRLLATRRRLDVSPLGAGALAGSSLPLDPAGGGGRPRLRRRLREQPRRHQRPRLRRRGAVRPRPPRRAPVADRRGGLPLVDRRVRLPAPRRRRGRPARRCCRRRRTPTSPSSPGARPVGSSATSPASWRR